MFHQYLFSSLTCLPCCSTIPLLYVSCPKVSSWIISVMILMYLSLLLRWMPSCHLGALPCEMGGHTIACLMSRTNMRLDRSSERKYHKDLCMYLCLFFFLFFFHSHEFMVMFQYSRMVLFSSWIISNWIRSFFPADLVWHIKQFHWRDDRRW